MSIVFDKKTYNYQITDNILECEQRFKMYLGEYNLIIYIDIQDRKEYEISIKLIEKLSLGKKIYFPEFDITAFRYRLKTGNQFLEEFDYTAPCKKLKNFDLMEIIDMLEKMRLSLFIKNEYKKRLLSQEGLYLNEIKNCDKILYEIFVKNGFLSELFVKTK